MLWYSQSIRNVNAKGLPKAIDMLKNGIPTDTKSNDDVIDMKTQYNDDNKTYKSR